MLLAVLLGGAGLLIAAVELPGRATRARLRAELRDAEMALTKAEARAAEVELLAEALAESERRAAAVTGLSEAGGPHAVLAHVAEAAARCGVDLHGLTPRPEEPHGTYRAWPFTLKFEAPFPAAHQFLADLERGRPLAEVTALTLNPAGARRTAGGGEPDGPVRLRGEVRFVVYAAPAGAL